MNKSDSNIIAKSPVGELIILLDCLNDMLLGNTKPNEKELRTAHNAEKLFLSGCYDIKVNWDI